MYVCMFCFIVVCLFFVFYLYFVLLLLSTWRIKPDDDDDNVTGRVEGVQQSVPHGGRPPETGSDVRSSWVVVDSLLWAGSSRRRVLGGARRRQARLCPDDLPRADDFTWPRRQLR